MYYTLTGPSEKTTPPVKNHASPSIATSTIAPSQKVPVKSIVTITSDTTLGVGNTTFLGDKTSPDFIHVAVQGTIVEFKYVSISFDGEKIVRGKALEEIPNITDKTITVGTTIPEGVPSEMLIWKSTSGKEYSFIIGYDGVNGKTSKTIEME